MDTISIIVPCLNEAENLPAFYSEFLLLSQKMNYVNFEIIFIDDGSTDNTLNLIKQLWQKDIRVHFISFSRNFGKESAMLAGLEHAGGDYACIIDADLQDPIMLIETMYQTLQSEKVDCVATRRISRKGEPPIRSFFAVLFYKLINKISSTQIAEGARDFRLMRREMVNSIVALKETNRFSKGIFSWVGFKTKFIEFENVERQNGITKWSFWKLVAYSIDGIVSFSTAPLLIASFAGFIFCLGAFLLMLYFIYQKLFVGISITGYAAMMCVILFLGGVQLLCIGVLGQYLAKVFIEVKNRPVYIVRESSDCNRFSS